MPYLVIYIINVVVRDVVDVVSVRQCLTSATPLNNAQCRCDPPATSVRERGMAVGCTCPVVYQARCIPGHVYQAMYTRPCIPGHVYQAMYISGHVLNQAMY